MARPKAHQSSTDVDAQIRRLEQEKQRLIVAEDQRRGAIIRDCLTGTLGDSIRGILRPIVAARDASLFGIGTTEQPASETPRVRSGPTAKPVRPIATVKTSETIPLPTR